MDAIINTATDRQFQISLLIALASIATVFTILEPFFVKDRLQERMKSVNDYRDRLRQQQRDNFSKRGQGLRAASAQGVLKEIVESLKLFEVFDANEARKKLMMAGFRGQRPVFIFMAARLGMPFVAAFVVAIYVYVFNGFEIKDNFGKLLATFFAFFSGFYLPGMYIKNAISKRQQQIQLAWPDALDLLLICVEAGMSIEAALQKVGAEVGQGSPELGEELGLTVAELSYLQERRQAYINLAERTGLDGVKGVTTALIQSEKYGTPLGQSLRVMAQENRDFRMQEAERKAAALPPKLTVPMIGFFLPVLFAVILGPAIMDVMGLEKV